MEILFPGSVRADRRFGIEFTELTPGEKTPVGPAAVTTLAVKQPDTPACALRVEYGGRVIAYSGDTAWEEGLIELVRGADLFIAEAYFFEHQVPFHLDYSTLLANRDRLDCKRIVLTHMGPSMLERRADAEFECATDGLMLTLG